MAKSAACAGTLTAAANAAAQSLIIQSLPVTDSVFYYSNTLPRSCQWNAFRRTLPTGKWGNAMFRNTLTAALLVTVAGSGLAQSIRPDQAEFKETYRELVETNTALSEGNCTLAAERMAARLRAAGFADSDLHIFTAPDHPKEGGLVAILPGRDAKAKAVLMLGHIDVVEAKRENWIRDPFKLYEENGYFYARGSVDDKSMSAIWVDTMARYKKEGFKPRRTLKMALTCGEETAGAFNGADYLAKNKRDLIDAAFAVNEGGGGLLDKAGKPIYLGIQVGEKLPQNYTLQVVNPGGHSSRPVPDNAIYRLSRALLRLETHAFPIEFNATTRDFFTRMAALTPGPEGQAMTALVKDPKDDNARATLVANPSWNAILHTTCVPTLLNGGHATNALPQRVTANVNCRIFPGTTPQQVQQVLAQVIDDPQVKVLIPETRSDPAPPPPLDPKVLGPAEKLAATMFPGVPQVRTMVAGGTDAAFMTPVGIPTYGISGYFVDADFNGVHGLDERANVAILYKSRDYLYELMKIYANSPECGAKSGGWGTACIKSSP
jgi:acetylornithine deacetylase/succinyl-diaminopimelate desuccinylase-like protein